NWSGQLGDARASWAPTPVSGGLTFSALAPGSYQTCGLTGAGAAYCWGWNSYGQLGTGSTNFAIPSPMAVAGGQSFNALANGGVHTCGLTGAGAAYCWGDNSVGQLGSGLTTSSATPVAVAGGLSFGALPAGFGHTCGLTSSGAAYCWGANGAGQLGDGSTTPSSSPVAVAGGFSFSDLAAGNLHTCGLTSSGTAYCWGDNGVGQLGDGWTTNNA